MNRIAVANDDVDVLVCPECGGPNLHHGRVDVRTREKEDGPGLQTSVSVHEVHQERLDPRDFYGRRDELRIQMRCEDCQARLLLILFQCKGQTLLTFEVGRGVSGIGYGEDAFPSWTP